MKRVAFGIEYDGTGFLGWQSQPQQPTVQDTVSAALAFVADCPVSLVCSGRTDTGVHARCQVVHCELPSECERSERAWILGTNSRLPATVALRWARTVTPEFHARFSARARSYRYRIVNRPVRLGLDARFASWERVPLDVPLMQQACDALRGTHDFSSFRTSACQARSPVRTVESIEWSRKGERVELFIQANGFLHHMVRNIVGSALCVGRGEQSPSWIAELLEQKDRPSAGPTAAPTGLEFLGARYPAHFGLPVEVTLENSA